MADNSANLSLPYLLPSQAQKHVTHNEALAVLDTVVQLAVADRDRTVPPETPAPGARHIVAAGATGDWAGQDGNVAVCEGAIWRFLIPQPGWRAWLLDEGADLCWRDGAWGTVAQSDSLDQIGVNTAADTVNRLAVAADATLLTHEGAGHRLKINKAAPGDTASLLFQTGWSGRAEMGLAGGDDFSIKMSANGSAWTETLRLDAASGKMTGTAVQSDAYDTTSGRLMAVGAFGLGGYLSDRGTPPGNDCDNAVRTGWYDVDGSTLNTPIGGQAGILSVIARNNQRVFQTYYRVAGNSTVEAYSRVSFGDGTSWSDWREDYHQGSILGTVSQSGGTPTGAIIERGSNGNGEYVRFADGTQICTNTLTSSAGGTVSWTFPASFPSLSEVDFYSVTPVARMAPYVANGDPSTGSYSSLSAWNMAGSRVAISVKTVAIGRWI